MDSAAQKIVWEKPYSYFDSFSPNGALLVDIANNGNGVFMRPDSCSIGEIKGDFYF